MKNVLTYTISLAIAGGLLWYVFKDINLDQMFGAIAQANYVWVAIYVVLITVAHWSRGVRWGLLLEPVVGSRPSQTNSFLSVMTGYFANLLVPRMGEVTRCGTLNRLENVPVNVSFGTVVAERLFDVLMLVVLIGLTVLLEAGRISELLVSVFAGKGGSGEGKTLLYLLLGLGVVGVVVAWFVYNKFKETLRQNALFVKIETFVLGLLDGLLSVRKLRQPGLFVFHTLLIWTIYYGTTWVLFLAMPQTAELGPRAALTILMMGTIGMAAPTQGGVGFIPMVGAALVIYGLTYQDGTTLATLMLLSQWLEVVIVGGIAFLIVLGRGKRVGNGAGTSAIEAGR